MARLQAPSPLPADLAMAPSIYSSASSIFTEEPSHEFDSEEQFEDRQYAEPQRVHGEPGGVNWEAMPEVRAAKERGSVQGRRLGVTWTGLTVKGVGADAAITENALSQFNIPKKIWESRRADPLMTIIEDSHGCVKPGEMLLVLGRPGAGCTTLLKMLANRRLGYASVEGDVKFGTLDHKEAAQYRGQIVMNTEDEIYFPTLTVAQTIDFATRMKVPSNLSEGQANPQEYQRQTRDFLLECMGISHTHDTKVGDEFVRGVSGGERKRVSIIETMATRGSVYCWDNSTRGLDASTALGYTKALRAMTDIFGLSTIVTLYQAGNGIYNQFDKVLVLDEGKQLYYGPMKQARPFMEKLGFVCSEGANVADFLTGVTVPTEHRIRNSFIDRYPQNADAIRTAYNASDIHAKMVAEYDYPASQIAREQTQGFRDTVKDEKNRSLTKKSPLTVGFYTQVRAATTRQYQIIWGDKATLFIQQASTLAQALIAGSLFYNAPANSEGIFIKSGALFMSLLFNSLLTMSEVTSSFSGRPVLAKHKGFALYHPAAFCIANILTDIPILIFQVSHFSLVLYFMVGMKQDVGSFFTFWLVIFTTTMCMTALFRAIGAAFSTFDGASKVSGFGVAAMIMYSGYMIPKPSMHPWFVWYVTFSHCVKTSLTPS
jgi:ABC-type multidrug transport system ATPase subunit